MCCAVLFADAFSADACDRTIEGLRFKLQKPIGFEFHFSECSDRIRREFFQTVHHESFKYVGFVVDKRRLFGKRFKDPKEVYEFSVGIVCEQVRPLLDRAKIIIDKNGDRNFRQKLEKSLRPGGSWRSSSSSRVMVVQDPRLRHTQSATRKDCNDER